jgi:protein-disulfide isomerase
MAKHGMKPKQQPPPVKQRGFGQRVTFWFFVLLGIAALTFSIMKLAAKPPADEIPSGPVNNFTITPKDWVKGRSSSGTVLIEYSDFQCPACAAYHPLLHQLVEELGDRIQFVYRHFPLQRHLNAELAARAAEAAGRQGRFWEMHDLIFEGQIQWADQRNPEETFVGYAKKLGLDIEKFRADLNSREVKDAVEEDRLSGDRAGVNGTPTFFLNGVKINNPQSYDAFKEILLQSVQSRS